MKKKLLFILIPVIVVILAGIGYAGWLLYEARSGEETATPKSYTVIDLDNISDSAPAFYYNNYGFYNESTHEYSYETSFSVIFNATAKRDHNNNVVPYDVVVTLVDQDSFLNGTTITSSYTYNATLVNGNKTITISNINSDRSITVTFTITSTGSEQYSSICSNLNNHKSIYLNVSATTSDKSWSLDQRISLTANIKTLLTVAKPTADNTAFVYTGSEQTYTVATNEGYTVTGNIMTNAGSQNVTVHLNEGYEWTDGTTSDVVFTFTIAKATPVITGNTDQSYHYTGSEIYYNTSGISSTFGSLSYTNNAKVAIGNYTVTISVVSSSNWNAASVASSFTIYGTISYSANSASSGNAPDAQNIVSGNTRANTGNLAKTGYSFNGWNTASNGSGTHYDEDAAITLSNDMTLYAEWQIINYTITYTLNDGTATNPTTYNINSASFTLSNPTRDGYTFKGWSGTGLTGDTNTSVSVTSGSTGNRSYTANWLQNICYNANNSRVYTNIATALSEATSGQTIYVYIGVSVDIDYDITIPSGITLVMPFIGKHYTSAALGNNITNSPLYQTPDVDHYNEYGNEQGDASSAKVTQYRSILLNMKNECDIIVNGTLCIGGAMSTKGNNGYYTEVNLSLGSSITVNNGGELDCFGYIKENSNDYRNMYQSAYNSYMSNSFDADRFLKIKSGAVLQTYLALYDAQRTGSLTGLVAANQPPFNCFDFASSQTYTIFEKGCEVKGWATLFGPSDKNVMKDTSVIKDNSSLFIINSGSLELEYMPSDVLYTSFNAYSNKTRFIINGSVSIGYIYISEYAGQVEVDTRNYFLPISCKSELYVKSGSTLKTDKTVKFLMGSKLFIDSNATFEINNKVAFYDSSTAPQYNPQATIFYNYTASDALLINNGTIVFNTNSATNGALGAKIRHTSTSGDAKINLTSISSDDKLTVTVPEGTTSTTATVTSSGLFNVNNSIVEAHFAVGTIYTSGNSNSDYYWIGDVVATYEITVDVDDTVLNPIYNYSIKLSENSDGSSSYDSELSDKSEPGTMSVSSGLYFNITYSRAYSITIYDGNNNAVSYSSSTWYDVNQNYRIHIVPNEGVKVVVTTYKDTTYSDNEEKWSQGLGHTFFYVQECATQNGSYTEISRVKSSGITAYVQKGYYFKVGYTWDSSDFMISSSGQNGFTANNRITTNNANFGPQPNSSWTNDSTSSLSPAFLAGNSSITGLEYHIELGYYSTHAKADEGGGCLSPDTLVLMKDGTYKEVQYIMPGDELIVFNHETGRIETSFVTFNDSEEEDLFRVINLHFSNGRTIGVIYEHGFFDLDLMTYVYITEFNYQDYIGHRFYGIDGSYILDNAFITEEVIALYSPITCNTFNYFTEGLLSMPGGIEGLFNYFDYDDNLKYDEDDYNWCIENIGLFTYEDLEYFGVTRETFDAYNAKYFKIAMAKGLLTEERVYYYVNRYGHFFE